jgi:hypothetical protein
VGALLIQRGYYERDFASRLQAEVALLDRQVKAGQQMDEEGEQLLGRLGRLGQVRQGFIWKVWQGFIGKVRKEQQWRRLMGFIERGWMG